MKLHEVVFEVKVTDPKDGHFTDSGKALVFSTDEDRHKTLMEDLQIQANEELIILSSIEVVGNKTFRLPD